MLLTGIWGEASHLYCGSFGAFSCYRLCFGVWLHLFSDRRVADTSYVMGGRLGVCDTHLLLGHPWPPPPPSPAAGAGGGPSVLSQQQTSVLSQQQTSASAFITQHQHSASTISILWRLRQQPTSGYHEGWDINRPCTPMVAMIPTGYGVGYSQTRLTWHSQGIRGGDINNDHAIDWGH